MVIDPNEFHKIADLPGMTQITVRPGGAHKAASLSSSSSSSSSSSATPAPASASTYT